MSFLQCCKVHLVKPNDDVSAHLQRSSKQGSGAKPAKYLFDVCDNSRSTLTSQDAAFDGHRAQGYVTQPPSHAFTPVHNLSAHNFANPLHNSASPLPPPPSPALMLNPAITDVSSSPLPLQLLSDVAELRERLQLVETQNARMSQLLRSSHQQQLPAVTRPPAAATVPTSTIALATRPPTTRARQNTDEELHFTKESFI